MDVMRADSLLQDTHRLRCFQNVKCLINLVLLSERFAFHGLLRYMSDWMREWQSSSSVFYFTVRALLTVCTHLPADPLGHT